MASISDRRRQREDFLIELYNRVADNPHGTLAMVEESDIAAVLSIDAAQADLISRWLVEQGYATFPVMGAVVSITPEGSNRAEELIEERERRESSLNLTLVLSVEEQRAVEAAIRPVREAIDNNLLEELDADDLAELNIDVHAIEEQLRSPKPKREVVRGALRTIFAFCNTPLASTVLGGSAVIGLQNLLHLIR